MKRQVDSSYTLPINIVNTDLDLEIDGGEDGVKIVEDAEEIM